MRRKTTIVRRKKGSYIMEAAVVLPIVITATITAILIIMFFYEQMTERCSLHLKLRDEAGMLTGKTSCLSDFNDTAGFDAELYDKRGLQGGTVYGKKYLVMRHKGILDKKGTFVVEGSSHMTDGPGYVRYCRAVRDDKDER